MTPRMTQSPQRHTSRNSHRTRVFAIIAAVNVASSLAAGPTSKPTERDGGAPGFAVGIEYTETGLASAYAPTGVQWAKTRLEAFEWKTSEPGPPIDGVHEYDWSCTDSLVLEYQKAGITRIQSYLSPASPWGSRNLGTGDLMPADDFIDDYLDWVEALVERYDGDGNNDAPGLVAPVRHWVIGPEWTNFWGSPEADYLRLLEITTPVIRKADPEAHIGTIPFLLWDVFRGNEPTAEEIEERLAVPNPPSGRKSVDGMLAILDRPDLFDSVSIHSLGDATELPPTLSWIRDRMSERGYQKPIHIDDAFPMWLLSNTPTVVGLWPEVYPVQEGQATPLWEEIEAIARLQEPAYSVAHDWLLAEAAKGTAKKVVIAYGERAAGIQLGNTDDWMPDNNFLNQRVIVAALIGASSSFGMIDVTHSAGLDFCQAREAGPRRPAWFALKLLHRRLAPFRHTVRERIGGARGPRGYRFGSGDPVWVLWDEDGRLELPGEAEPTVSYTLDVPPGTEQVRVIRTPTSTESGPEVDIFDVVNEQVVLELDSTPVFVEPWDSTGARPSDL